jgi:transposase-like protein
VGSVAKRCWRFCQGETAKPNRPTLFRGPHFEDIIINVLKNIIEQDHRFIKKRITASLGFRSAEGAWRTRATHRHAGRTRCVLFAISHVLLLVFLFVGVD